MDTLAVVSEKVGGMTALAKLLDVSPRAVFKWRSKGIPAERVMPIYRACGGAVTPHDLRPDLYPDADYRPALAAEQTDGAAS